jgi:uncharacterized membrane protein YfcA
MHVELGGLIAVGLAMFVGAVVQGSLGFGSIVTAFSVIVLVDPVLLPQAILISTLPILFTVFVRSRHDVDWREAMLLVAGRLPGVALGTVIVKEVSPTVLAYAGAGLVLFAVGVTAFSRPVPHTTGTLTAAGFLSGLFATSTGIGGPPLALMYQSGTGEDLRATVGTVMVLGVMMTIAGLAIGGELSTTDIRTGVALMPFAFAGVLCAPLVRGWVDLRIRSLVQVISVLGALLAIVRLSV